jgi:hypothetical protein
MASVIRTVIALSFAGFFNYSGKTTTALEMITFLEGELRRTGLR